MASIANDQLDDPIVSDGDISFAGGQVSATPANAVAPGGFVEAQNMDFDNFGRLVTRRGALTTTGNVLGVNWEDITATWNGTTSYWGSTLGSTAIDACYYFDTDASEYVILAQGGTLLQGTEGSVYASIASSTYSGSRVYFAQINNRLYYCDGVGALKYVDSAVAHQAITAGKVTSITITEPGTGYNAVPAITFTHNGGASGAATAVLGYGGKVVSATVTTAGSGYSATTPPTIAFAAAPAGGITAQGKVNISQVPSKPKFLVSHTNRLFCASADTAIPGDTVYVSDILDGDSWDLVGASLRVGGDGDPITALYPWFGNYLIVFKQRSIWTINADPLVDVADWEIRLINNRVGCVSHRSVQAVGKDVFFLAKDGVRSLASIESGTQTEVGLPISAPVQDEIDAIDGTYIDKTCAAYYRNRYFIAITQDGYTAPNCVLVFNAITRSWCGCWTGWSPSDFCVTGFSGKIRLNFADATGKFWTWDDFTPPSSETVGQYRDDTTPYESYVITRAYSYGDPLVDKLGDMIQFISENRLTDSNITAYAYYDRDMSGSFSALDTAITMTAGDRLKQRAFNLVPKGKFNVIQFKLGTTNGRLPVNAVATTAYSDTLKKEL